MFNHLGKHVSLVHSGLRLYNDRGEKLILDSPSLVAFLPPFLSGHQIEIGQKTSGGSKSVKSCPVPTPPSSQPPSLWLIGQFSVIFLTPMSAAPS